MNLIKKNLTSIIVIGILFITLSLLFVRIFPELPVVSDSADYHEIATNINSNGTYVTISDDKILYPPLYPIFLALVYSLGLGTFATVYFFQYLLVGGIAVFTFLILRKFTKTNIWLSVIASLSIMFWPYLILYSQLISSEILYSFLLIFSLFLLIHINKDSKPKILIATGIILGLAILTRPVALLLFPWILIALFIFSKMSKIFGEVSIPWKKYLIIGAIMIITVLPWEIYVKVKYDRVIPVASNLSYVFEKANGTKAYLSTDSTEQKEVSFLEAKLKNIYLFWNPGATGYHLDILKEKYPAARHLVTLYRIAFLLILGLAIVGAFLQRKNRFVILLAIVILYFWALHTVLFPFPRYTLPIIPFTIIVAISTITYGYNRFTNKENTGRDSS